MRKTKIKLQKQFFSESIDLIQSRKIHNLKTLTPKFNRTGWITPLNGK